jgi:RimJ/RimL family protein N-acetyltransferase
MIRLRPFKISDCEHLIDWVNDEKTFTMWCANKFTYPLTIEQLIEYIHMYDNVEDGWSFTALDERGIPIGHLLMRMANYENESVHFGFIIVDPSRRGSGYGKEMVSLAAKYAFEILKVKRITLGVFSNNPAAHQCYKSVGFINSEYHEDFFPYKNEKWGLYDMVMVI